MMEKARKPKRRVFTTRQAGEALGVSGDTVHNWIVAGINDPRGNRVKLKATRLGRWYRIARRDLVAFRKLFAAEGEGAGEAPKPTPKAKEKREAGRKKKARQRLKDLGIDLPED